jgi:site-specific recombinase XerD
MPEIDTVKDVTAELVIVFFKRIQTRERIVGKGILKVGLKNSTLRTYARRLKSFFKWLVIREVISNNPFDSIALPQAEYIDHRALKGVEIKKIMGAVAQCSPTAFLLKRDIAMIGVLTFCGIRRNELIGLETRDVDLFNGLLTVRSETSKSKRTRKIPINTHLRLHLMEYLTERKRRNSKCAHLWISHNGDKAITRHGMKHWVTRISRQSGVKFHLHRFRHTFATNLAMQDVGIVKIQNLMGHSDIKMTSSYLRSVSTTEMREDVNKLSFENLG